MAYWFVLGREKLLSAAEIAAVLDNTKIIWDHQSPILKYTGEIKDPHSLMNRLGGTIKIAEELATDIAESNIPTTVADELRKTTVKIHFGISLYDSDPLVATRALAMKIGTWGKAIKQTLKTEGKSIRHVFNYEAVLSSVAVTKNNLCTKGGEFIVIKNNKSFSVAKTLVVQPFEDFSARDFGRPGRDDLSGMLPPKLAMTMINLARPKLSDTILDPFCGSGTILTEALLMGYTNLIGSDLSEKAMDDTQKNLDWTIKNEKIGRNQIKLFSGDARKISNELTRNSIDIIVSEPYLGKPLKGNESPDIIRTQAQELKQLYIASLRELFLVLKPNGRVVFLIPRFRVGNSWITIDMKNEIQKNGFTILPLFENFESLLYARANQKVGREVWCFIKK